MAIQFSFRSNRLHNLAVEVWESLPPQERAVLECSTILMIDDPYFLPTAGKRPWGATFRLRVRKFQVKKFIFIIYLNRARLRQEPRAYVKDVIAHLLGSVPGANKEFYPQICAASTEG